MYQSLQISRAIAAMLVTCFHLGGNLAKPKYFGQHADMLENMFSFGGKAGVAFFFVLSGFIISRVHWKDMGHPERIGQYLKRRIIRVYPTYLLVFALVYAMALLVPATRSGMVTDVGMLLKALLLIPQSPEVAGATGAPVIIVAWTLQYEMLFYLAFALAIVGKGLALGCLTMLVGVLAAKMSGVLPEHWLLDFMTRDLIWLFALGVLTDRICLRLKTLKASGFWMVVAALAFLALAFWDVAHREQKFLDLYLAYGAISAFLIVFMVLKENEAPQRFNNKLLVAVGDASYVQYLVHFPLISVGCKVLTLFLAPSLLNAVIAYGLLLAACVMVSVVFHRSVERPMIDVLNGKVKSLSPSLGV